MAKMGKGYRNGIPYGKVSKNCEECNEPVVSIQMAIGQYGQECTSEVVCPKCGLVYQGAFAVLNRYEVEYSTEEFESHEDWIKRMKENDSHSYVDYDENLEFVAAIEGGREQTDDNYSYAASGKYKNEISNRVEINGNKSKSQRFKAMEKLIRKYDAHKQSKHIPEHVKRRLRYFNFVDSLYSYISTCNVKIADYKLIFEDVRLLITKAMKNSDKGIRIFHHNASYQEIITCILIWRATKSLGRRIIGLKKELGSIGEKNDKGDLKPYFDSTKYRVIKPRLDLFYENGDLIGLRRIVRPATKGRLGLKLFKQVDREISSAKHLNPKEKQEASIDITGDKCIYESATEC